MKKILILLIFIYFDLNICTNVQDCDLPILPNEVFYIIFSNIFSENIPQNNNNKNNVIDFLVDNIEKIKTYSNLSLVNKNFRDLLKFFLKDEMLLKKHFISLNLKSYLNKNPAENIVDNFINNAYKIKNKDLIKILIQDLKKINLDIISVANNRLMEAVKNNDIELVNRLICSGADVNFNYTSYSTDLTLIFYKNYQSIIGYLINSYLPESKNIKLSDSCNWTPLMWAIKNQNVNLVNLLLNSGADPNLQNADLETALFHAIYRDNIEIILALISSGADLNIKTNDNLTLLMVAVSQNCLDIIKLLLDLNLDPKEKNIDGFQAIDFAKSEKAKKLIQKYSNHNGYNNFFYKIIERFRLICNYSLENF